jgi:hypothetical protein
MNESRSGGELKVDAGRLAGPGLGLGTSTLQASRPAALDDDSARFALDLKRLLLDDRQDRQGYLGGSQVLSTCADNVRVQCQSGSKRRASDVSSIVAETIALTDVVGRGLFGREVGLDPSTRVGAEKKSPEVAVAAVKQYGWRAAFGTASNATKEVLSIHNGCGAPAHGHPNDSGELGTANGLATNDLSTC